MSRRADKSPSPSQSLPPLLPESERGVRIARGNKGSGVRVGESSGNGVVNWCGLGETAPHRHALMGVPSLFTPIGVYSLPPPSHVSSTLSPRARSVSLSHVFSLCTLGYNPSFLSFSLSSLYLSLSRTATTTPSIPSRVLACVCVRMCRAFVRGGSEAGLDPDLSVPPSISSPLFISGAHLGG